MRSEKVITIGLVFVNCIVAIAAAGAWLNVAYAERVFPRTVAAGLDVGGDPLTTATQKLKAHLDELTQEKMSITVDGQHAQLGLPQLGVTIDQYALTDKLAHAKVAWAFLLPGFWRDLGSAHNLKTVYSLDQANFTKTLQTQFPTLALAKDATLTVKDGQLVVVPAQSGMVVSTLDAQTELDRVFNEGAAPVIELHTTRAQPALATAAAERAKTQITQTFVPLTITADSTKTTISQADIYGLLSYTPRAGQLEWKIDEDKLHTYVKTVAVKKLSVAMIPKTIQSDSGAVLTEGRDGQTVNETEVFDALKQALAQKQDPATSITVAVTPVAFTQKTVDPQYVAGLYPGLYIDINLSVQKLFVMEGDVKISEHLISSGKASLPTPKGLFYIKNKIELAQSRLYPGLWMKKWNALARNPDGSGYDGYGIHGLPCFDRNCNSIEGTSHLGRPVSHGCIRLDLDAANYFYDKIPVGTPVNIH